MKSITPFGNMFNMITRDPTHSNFLENMAIDGVLSHFQRSNIKTVSVIENPLLLVNPADLMSEFKFSFFQVSAKRLSM